LKYQAHKAHKELGLAYNTTHKIYTKLRQCIYKFTSKDDCPLSGEVEKDESYFGGKRKGSRGAKSKIPVFGILERNGKVKVEIVKKVKVEIVKGCIC
jgi:transposase